MTAITEKKVPIFYFLFQFFIFFSPFFSIFSLKLESHREEGADFVFFYFIFFIFPLHFSAFFLLKLESRRSVAAVVEKDVAVIWNLMLTYADVC